MENKFPSVELRARRSPAAASLGDMYTGQLRARRWWFVLSVVIGSLLITSPASAHAELRQSSPEAGETVGGDFHQIVLLLFGWNAQAPYDAQLFDPAGVQIEADVKTDNQRLVIPIEGLTVPGEYTVSYMVTGLDGDVTAESFTFRFEPNAAPPKGITIEVNSGEGFDFVALALLMAVAALAAFLVHRFMTALRDHRRAQAARSLEDEVERVDVTGGHDEELTG